MMLTGEALFHGRTVEQVIRRNKRCEFKEQLEGMSGSVSNQTYTLLKKMLMKDARKRISAKVALNSLCFYHFSKPLASPKESFKSFNNFDAKKPAAEPSGAGT